MYAIKMNTVVINRKTTKFENNSQYNVMIFICFFR